MTSQRRVTLTRLGLFTVFAGAVEFAPRAGLVDALTLVPLSTMLNTLLDGLSTPQLWRNFGYTAGSILTSFFLAAVIGVSVGFGLWTQRWLRRALNPYLTSYYSLPVFAFYPVLVAIFGLNRTPVILLATAYACVAVITNTAIGLDSVPQVYIRTARVYQFGRWSTLTRVLLPAAAPHVFSGLKLAVTYSVIGVIASEFILATQGLGWLVSYHYNGFKLAEMYASILLILALAIAIAALITYAERRMWAIESSPQ